LNHYNPSIQPDSAAWLNLDEDERIELVMNFHERADASLTSIQAHAIIHVIVENQIALETQETADALARLLKQGLDRHDAVHAIGAVLAEHTFNIIHDNTDDSDKSANRDQQRFLGRLRKLTAARWRSGNY